jgi:hypothetical protein
LLLIQLLFVLEAFDTLNIFSNLKKENQTSQKSFRKLFIFSQMRNYFSQPIPEQSRRTNRNCD